MIRYASIMLTISLCLLSAEVNTKVAGSTVLGVAAAEQRDVAVGWSVKRQILGQAVLNERIGVIDDIIISPDKAVSYAIVRAGGFLSVPRHDVAIPVNQRILWKGNLVLPGATKDALKATPAFEYARSVH